jgi:hypothetical protein
LKKYGVLGDLVRRGIFAYGVLFGINDRGEEFEAE